MSVYTAYQLAQPTQSLLDSMTTRGFGPAVDTTAKKKGIMDDAQEKVEKAFKRSEERSGKWKPVTTILDTAAGFVDPATAAILGAVSGGLSGFDRMRAYEGLKKDTKGMGKYSFMDDYMKGVKKQISGLKTDVGDVLVSAGTGALKNFAMGKASEAMAGLKSDVPGLDAGTEFLDKSTEAAELVTDAGADMAEKAAEKTAKDVVKKTAEGYKPPGADLSYADVEKLDPLMLDATKVTGDASKSIPKKIDLANVKEMPTKFDLGSGKSPDLTETLNAAKRSKTIDVASKFKPEAADWIKNLQQGGGKDMLSNLINPEDIMGSIAGLTQVGQGFLTPLLNYNKPSDFRLY
jgi:hypothetical protein|tara:strand:- start:2876 stop:3919 length:1044 start_codon:yes stop_codon:yes gene_type:complete